MSERSVRCPTCPFAFMKLIDAANFHAYQCPNCGHTRQTGDRRPGNRPADMCALCDRPINLRASGNIGPHLYLGPGWVHGGGAESIPIHNGCGTFARIDHLLEVNPAFWTDALNYFRREVGGAA